MSEKMLTTPQAAERLGVSTSRVRQLILNGRLPSQQFGRDHLIREEDLALVADRKTGRPKKEEVEPKPAVEQGIEEAEPQPIHLIVPKTAGKIKQVRKGKK